MIQKKIQPEPDAMNNYSIVKKRGVPGPDFNPEKYLKVEAEAEVKNGGLHHHVLHAPGHVGTDEIAQQPGPGAKTETAHKGILLHFDGGIQGRLLDLIGKEVIVIIVWMKASPG